ncbi:hypothetical protein [Pseudoclavibacter sp. Z016]|uniref:hypothetical protein n=1 Tax=Pseudoclavibacter sp. Z016 TaxID=2080581 RepID=UPI000CE89A07|nr:hypothetical protein [Pseudoclavibacter sp. Z016]PPF74021.1 hypothetical protein C5B99_15070 [Pseudoclavibacter sp. Z016]
MTSAATSPREHTGPLDATGKLLVPTVVKQCWLFMVGSALFALGSAPVLSEQMGSQLSNLFFFVGAWFFTSAGLIQLFLSGAVAVPVSYAPGRMVRAEWLTASTQSFGTLLFNVSTTAALHAKSLTSQEKLVWNPDAGGSVAFLVSGCVAFIAFAHTNQTWSVRSSASWSVVINFVGCVAFGASAVGAYILPGGATINASLATWGTFIGAVCFFLASLVVLPGAMKAGATPTRDSSNVGRSA